MPKAKVQDPISTQEATFAYLILSGTMTDKEAAARAGLNPGSASHIKGKPQIQAYMREHRTKVQAELAQHEAEALTQVNLTREEILQSYWAFARLAPERTNNNITGQIKALDAIRDMLGYTAANASNLEEKTQKPEVYKAAWLRRREAGILDEEEDEIEVAPEPPRPVPQKPQAVHVVEPEFDRGEFTPEPTSTIARSRGVPFGAYQ